MTFTASTKVQEVAAEYKPNAGSVRFFTCRVCAVAQTEDGIGLWVVLFHLSSAKVFFAAVGSDEQLSYTHAPAASVFGEQTPNFFNVYSFKTVYSC